MTNAALQTALGYTFSDGSLLTAALTHRSAAGRNNERLEFLGDAVLSAVIGEALYRSHPNCREGELSRLRASLVKGETLSEIARELDLGRRLRLGAGELKSGGHRRASILADALEAIIGAVFLDSDFDTCRRLILALYRRRLQSLVGSDAVKDPKTRLQEYLQGRGLPLPEYGVVEISGAEHARRFTLRASAAGLDAEACAGSRRRAEQRAAESLLEKLDASVDGASASR